MQHPALLKNLREPETYLSTLPVVPDYLFIHQCQKDSRGSSLMYLNVIPELY